MNREDSVKKLKYGSFKAILDGYNKGAGIFFRSDVEILLDYIRELEMQRDSL